MNIKTALLREADYNKSSYIRCKFKAVTVITTNLTKVCKAFTLDALHVGTVISSKPQ